MRDAFVAALTLNVFHRHTDRVRMANIAQVVNVLQSMILTDTIGTGHMVLTPTYHVFKMYKGFMDATYLPMETLCDSVQVRGDSHAKDGRKVPLVSASAARGKDGSVIISLANVSLDDEQEISLTLDGLQPKTVAGTILSSNAIDAYNDFENPDAVAPKEFTSAKIKGNVLSMKVPSKSIVVLNIK